MAHIDLHIRLLGHLSLVYKGEEIYAIQRPRLQSFLAYLLLHRSAPLLRQRVAFLFWPDSSEQQARRNLRKMLHDLRQALPTSEQFLHVDSSTLHWRDDSPFRLDVVSFDELLYKAGLVDPHDPSAERTFLEEAVALYQGDLLPGCYDDWIFPERERLREAYCQALARLIRLAEDERHYEAAIRYADSLLRYDPLREAVYGDLMRLHALRGERASALRVYHTCVARLQQDLGVAPGPEVEAAHARLLGMEVPDRPRPETARQANITQLVGRTQEWRVLQTAWRQAANGTLHFCLIWGEAGIGKTRLAQELLVWTGEQGFSTAYTRAYEMAGALAYTPIIEWLRAPPLQTAMQTLDPLWLSEIGRLLPDLLAERPELPRPEPLDERWQRQRLFQALTQAFAATQQPLLLVLDDIQWCDSDTLEWLHYLLNHSPDSTSPAIFIMCTARRAEVDGSHPVNSLWLASRDAGRLAEITLPPLSQPQTTQLATQLSDAEPDAKSAADLFVYTEGNPFYIVETLSSSRWKSVVQRTEPDILAQPSGSTLPPKVYTLIRSRLAHLSIEARQLAGVCAVIGRAFNFDLLRQASRLSESPLMQALDELWRRGIVREQADGRYDFSHDRIRDVAYAEIGPVQRPLLHGHVARALAKLYAEDVDRVSAQLGLHYERAGDASTAIRYYQQAADVSLTLATPGQALVYADKVLAMLDTLPQSVASDEQRLDSLLSKARALIGARGWTHPERKDVLDRAYELATQLDDLLRQFEALRGLREYYTARGEIYYADAIIRLMAALAKRLSDSNIREHVERAMTIVHFFKGEFQAASELYELRLRHPDRAKFRRDTFFVPPIMRAQVTWMLGYPDRACRQAFESLRLANELGRPHGRLVVYEFMLYLLQQMGDKVTLRRLGPELRELCTAYGYPEFAMVADVMTGWLKAEDGELAAGLDQMLHALAGFDRSHNLLLTPYFLSLLAEIQALAGEVAAALDTLHRAQQMSEQSGERMWSAEILRLTGSMQERLGYDEGQVEESYRAALRVARQQEAKSLELRAVMSLARLWQRQGKRAQAHSLLAKTVGWFCEGFDTVDLQKAGALLAELA